MNIKNRKIISCDFEASCLPQQGSYPIEVAFTDINLQTKEWLIKPSWIWTMNGIWDAKAQHIHGLTKEYLEQDGKTTREVCDEIDLLLADNPIVVSDNPECDYFWLAVLYHAENRKLPVDKFYHIFAVAQKIKKGYLTMEEFVAVNNLAHSKYPHVHRAGPDSRGMAEMIRIFSDL